MRLFGKMFPGSKVVSIHASVKDATSVIGENATFAGFNPRICKRCDYRLHALCFLVEVSIHASVKDATAFGEYPAGVIEVSIHASVKDATYNRNRPGDD